MDRKMIEKMKMKEGEEGVTAEELKGRRRVGDDAKDLPPQKREREMILEMH